MSNKTGPAPDIADPLAGEPANKDEMGHIPGHIREEDEKLLSEARNRIKSARASLDICDRLLLEINEKLLVLRNKLAGEPPENWGARWGQLNRSFPVITRKN